MSKPSVELLEFLTRNPLPWLHWDEQKQKLIVVVDNHLMSTYRACPQFFVYSHVQGIHRKSNIREDEKQRVWNLEFGIVLHKMLELYYKDFRDQNFNCSEWSTKRAIHEWQEVKMDVFSEEKEYKLIGGMFGFVGLLTQYCHVMTPLNEKIRIIGQEVSFGKNLEVPLYIGEFFEIYLAGRMDLIVDDGYFICPMDHKSEGTFRPDPGAKYETDEGPTGYIFTLANILPKLVSEDLILKRDCSKILMNLIQKKPETDPAARFKRVTIRKTGQQLVAYQWRMISSVENLLHDMEKVARGLPVQRNTTACSNWFHRDCVYRDIDRQQSTDTELITINNGYIKLPIWDTETVKPTT